MYFGGFVGEVVEGDVLAVEGGGDGFRIAGFDPAFLERDFDFEGLAAVAHVGEVGTLFGAVEFLFVAQPGFGAAAEIGAG